MTVKISPGPSAVGTNSKLHDPPDPPRPPPPPPQTLGGAEPAPPPDPPPPPPAPGASITRAKLYPSGITYVYVPAASYRTRNAEPPDPGPIGPVGPSGP